MVDFVVLTNFSTAADRALEYVTLLAAELGARVHLLHFWQHSVLDPNYFLEEPVSSSYFPGFQVSTRQEHEQALQVRCAAFGKETCIEPHFLEGSVEERLPWFRSQLTNPLVVVGKCNTEGIPDEMVDSTSLHLLDSKQLPLLIVPERKKLVLPTQVVLVSDGKDFQVQGSPFLSILGQLEPWLSIVEVTLSEEQATKSRLNDLVAPKFPELVRCTTHVIPTQDIAYGIRQYCLEAEADWLVMVYRRHSLLERLFHESVIAEFIRHPAIPLLILPE